MKLRMCPCGGIGRRNGLKIRRELLPCRFKSGCGHHLTRSFLNLKFMNFFSDNINVVDKGVDLLIENERRRLQSSVELIASENIVSKAVLEAQGSILTNKYAEGYPRKRYYGGCEYVDEIEDLAISRLKRLFNAAYANVQPHSGSQANQAVFF